jgi:diguanylate cyclase (GGDEF)-like protein
MSAMGRRVARRDREEGGFPVGLLTLAFVLTIIAFSWFAWVTVDSGRAERLFSSRLSRIEQLHGVIIHLDEVLTMSARMAAATGEARWEDRYRQFEPQLTTAINEARRLGKSEEGIGSVRRTDQANTRLVEMEERAFVMVRRGRLQDATAILGSSDYRVQKALYKEGIASFVLQARGHLSDSLRSAQRVDLLSVVTALFVGGISFVAWLSTVRGIRRWRGVLERSVREGKRAKQAFSRDVTSAREETAEMTRSAHHDFLTGLPNRMLLNDRIGQAIALAPRHKKRIAVLYLDLDGFKQINDSLGHAVGDQLLQAVAACLVKCVRGSDTVSRLGGDEFIVLLSEAELPEDAALIAKRILDALATPHSIGAQRLKVTTSIGVSLYPEDGTDAETLIANADTAMYQAKASGRHTFRFFVRGMNVRAPKAQTPDESLGRALDWEEFARTIPGFGLGAGGAVSSAGRMKFSEEPLPPE